MLHPKSLAILAPLIGEYFLFYSKGNNIFLYTYIRLLVFCDRKPAFLYTYFSTAPSGVVKFDVLVFHWTRSTYKLDACYYNQVVCNVSRLYIILMWQSIKVIHSDIFHSLSSCIINKTPTHLDVDAVHSSMWSSLDNLFLPSAVLLALQTASC